MSRTDKDRPEWVQIRDSDFPWPLNAHHMCNMGLSYWQHDCDIDFHVPVTRRNGKFRGCEYWPRYIDNDKLYGRGRYRRSREFKKDKKARSDLRRLRSKWNTLERDDIDSNENLPTQRWLWRRWYWD